jgi:hypothetical protein
MQEDKLMATRARTLALTALLALAAPAARASLR